MRSRWILASLLCLALTLSASARRVTLNYTNADIRPILQNLAKAADMNIFISPEVQGTVTVSVKNKEPLDALKVILSLQRVEYRYKVLNNTLVVATPAKLSEIPDNLFD